MQTSYLAIATIGSTDKCLAPRTQRPIPERRVLNFQNKNQPMLLFDQKTQQQINKQDLQNLL